MPVTESAAPKADPRIINADLRHPKPNLIAPTKLGYLYIGAAIAPPRMLVVLPSAHRERVLRQAKALAAGLTSVSGVLDAKVFRAIAIPPAPAFSRVLRTRRGTIPVAAFDVIVLVRTVSVEDARTVQASQAYQTLVDFFHAEAQRLHVMAAYNARRIADVDTSSQGLFLFNHFAAANAEVMLKLWDHLAGWYVVETGLRNSVALAPLEGESADYPVVNWARWDVNPPAHFAGMLARPSFWRFVTANLDENDAVSMPVYCRLAGRSP